MKRTIALILLFAMLMLAGCGQSAPTAEPAQNEPADGTPESGEAAQIANPWREIGEAEARALEAGALRAPEGAENARWSVMEAAGQAPLVQLSFDLDGLSFTAREQLTDDAAADVSGLYYEWTAQTDMLLKNWEESAKAGTCYRHVGEDGFTDLCAWYDTAKGISYTLSVTAEDPDGFDLRAIAEQLCVPAAPAETGRQDGERFETVIILEGMEETVRYEHVRSEALGFEMDYDYENLVRRSEAERECFISVWDDAQNPENYLEITYVAEDAGTAAASVRERLSADYDLLESERELERAGSCLRIEASELKGTGRMADQLQAVYVIPADEGCIVAAAHYAIEAAEGFGRRFNYLLNTLSVIA